METNSVVMWKHICAILLRFKIASQSINTRLSSVPESDYLRVFKI